MKRDNRPIMGWILGLLCGVAMGLWGTWGCTPFPICTQDDDCARPLRCDAAKGVCEAECSDNSDCKGDKQACINLRCADATANPGGGLSPAQAAFLKRLQEHVKFAVDPKTQKVSSMTLGSEGVEITFTPATRQIWVKGANLHVVNGAGKTDAPSKSSEGTGNLILGYNEKNDLKVSRTGSHNLIIGTGHSYDSYGSLIAGQENSTKGPYSSVLGGKSNTARERTSVVVGGQKNEATHKYAVVCGGMNNKANNEGASILGGQANIVYGYYSAVVGGQANVANGNSTVVLGGHKTTSNRQYQTILGSNTNNASCDSSRVCK